MVIANIFSHVGLMENAILPKDFAQCLVNAQTGEVAPCFKKSYS
jgi:hypothetical protein